MKKILPMFFALSLYFSIIKAQNRMITGTVVGSDDRQTLPGASVKVEGTAQGVLTDLNGKFNLSIPESGNLVVSYIGYITQNVKITNKTVYDMVL